MKALLLTGLLFILILSGCRKESATLPLLQSVEELIPMYADSASTLLDSIKAPDELGNKDFAHWCMLRGKATDETATGLLPIYQWQRAQKWFMKHGTAEEQAQIALYLGRAYVEDGEYDKAMKIYAEALQLAKEHQAYNVAGYICAYMADLYGFRDIISERLEKREEACEFFKKAENYKSYAYALKDLACECTLTDSFNCTIPLLQKADSISQLIPNKDLIAAVANAFGLVYKMQGKYKDAEKHHLKAIETGSEESYKDSVALLHIYIKDNQLAKAHEIIESTTKKKDICYNINEAYYLLCKAEGKYKEALHYKEICSDILDSLTLAQNETKVLEIEKKVQQCQDTGRERTVKDCTAKGYDYNHYYHLPTFTVCGRIYHLLAKKQNNPLPETSRNRQDENRASPLVYGTGRKKTSIADCHGRTKPQSRRTASGNRHHFY